MVQRTPNVLSQTASAQGGMATVKNRRFQNQQVSQISKSAGLNPFAGDLTNAFNSFFGQVSKSIDNLQQVEFQKDKIEAKRFALEKRKQASVDAVNAFNSGDFTSLEEAKKANKSQYKDEYGYGQAFEESYGQATGGKMWADFEAASVNVAPEQYEQFASDWWENNYADGTGSATADLQVQAAWQKNYQQKRVSMALKAVENQRETALVAAQNSAQTIVKTPGGWGYEQYYELKRKVGAINPTLPDGKVRAATLDLLMSASVANGKVGTQNFLAFLDRADISSDDEVDMGPAPSLADRFPQDIAALKQKTYSLLQNYVTVEGVEAVTRFNKDLTTVLNETQGNVDERIKRLTDMSTSMGGLLNTPGVNMTMIGTARAEVAKHLTTATKLKLGMNRVAEFVKGGGNVNPHPSLTTESVKELMPNMMGQPTFNFLADSDVAINAGNMLNEVIQRFGLEAVDDDTLQMIKAGLMSDDQSKQEASLSVLRVIDPTFEIASKMFKDDTDVLSMFTVNTDGSITADLSDAQNPGLLASRDFVRETGIEQIITGETKKDKQAEGFEDFINTVVERTEEVKGMDGWFTGNSYGTANVNIEARDIIKSITADAAAKMLSANGAIDESKLAKTVARRVAPLLVFNDGVLQKRGEMTGVIPVDNMVPRKDGTGGYENVISNMNDAADSLPLGLTNIRLNSGTLLEDGDQVSVNYNRMMGLDNVYEIIDQDQVPLVLPVNGAEIIGSLQYDKNFKPYGMFDFEEDDERRFKLTGNKVEDEQIMKRFVHPAIRLMPMTRPDGQTSGYRIGVEPFFKNYDGEYMTYKKLEELGKAKNFVPTSPFNNLNPMPNTIP